MAHRNSLTSMTGIQLKHVATIQTFKVPLVNAMEIADIEIWIDAETLVEVLGPKAVKALGRIARYHFGALTLKAVNVRREDVKRYD